MASVDFQKIKVLATLRAEIRHSDKDERLKNKHKNEHIDKEITNTNLQLYDESIKQTYKRFKDRIAYLDATTNTNTRHDRVTAYGLLVPCPAGIKNEDEFFRDVCTMFSIRFGKSNIINAYFHKDEKHEYIDSSTLQVRTSLSHAHFYIVPEIDGRLCAKQFSSKSKMREIDMMVDKLCREKYKVPFRTGTAIKSKATVEDLKKSSSELTEDLLTRLNDKSRPKPKKALTGEIKLSEDDFNTLIAKANAYDTLSEKFNQLKAVVDISNKAVRTKEILQKSNAELLKGVEKMEHEQEQWEQFKKDNEITPKTFEFLAEIANISYKNEKLETEKAALIEALKEINEKTESSTIKNIIEKALDSVKEQQTPEKQKTHTYEYAL